MVMTFS